MAIKLNRVAVDHAKKLIEVGEVEYEKKWNWKEHQATEDEKNKFLNTHDISEYGQWFLGIDDAVERGAKQSFLFPYGDLKIVHRNALVVAEEEARKHGYNDIARVALTLLAQIDAKKRSVK
jgi:hypothetical protein